MQIRQKASAMTNKKPVLLSRLCRAVSYLFQRYKKNYHIHTKTIKPVILFHKK